MTMPSMKTMPAQIGKFYELYEEDAEIGAKELNWKMTISGVGRCRQVGCPESGIEDAIQKLVSLGYKVACDKPEFCPHERNECALTPWGK